MADPDLFFEACEAVLDTVVAYYAPLPGHALPARRYVAAGQEAWDCEQLVVWPRLGYSGLTTTQVLDVDDCLRVRSLTIALDIIRCDAAMGTKGTPPAPEAIQAHAQTLLADPVLMFDAVLQAYKAETLGHAKGIAFDTWEPFEPQGGLHGGRLTIRYLLV